MKKIMTAQEFVAYWTIMDPNTGMTLVDYIRENIAEREMEHLGEVAQFGDSGIGMVLRLNESKAELAKIERQLRRLGALKG